MIIFIGAIVLIVAGILLCVFGYKTEKIKYSWETQTRTNKVETWRLFAGCVILGVCGSIVFGSLIAFEVAETIDNKIMGKMLQIAKEQGYTDLHLINKEFVVEALKREME